MNTENELQAASSGSRVLNKTSKLMIVVAKVTVIAKITLDDNNPYTWKLKSKGANAEM